MSIVTKGDVLSIPTPNLTTPNETFSVTWKHAVSGKEMSTQYVALTAKNKSRGGIDVPFFVESMWYTDDFIHGWAVDGPAGDYEYTVDEKAQFGKADASGNSVFIVYHSRNKKPLQASFRPKNPLPTTTAASKKPKVLIRTLPADTSDLERRLASAERKNATLEQTRITLTTESTTLRQVNAELEAKLRLALSQLDNTSSALNATQDELAAKLKAVESRMGELERVNGELMGTVDELKVKLEEAERKAQVLESENSRIAGELDDAISARDTALLQVIAFKRKIEIIEKEEAEGIEKLTTAESEIEVLKAKLAQLEEVRIPELEAAIQAANSAKFSIDGQLGEKVQAEGLSSAKIQDLERQLATLRIENQTTTDDLTDAREEIEELRRLLAEKDRALLDSATTAVEDDDDEEEVDVNFDDGSFLQDF